MKGTVLLTDALAATVMPGGRKELTLRDARTPGLMLRVRDSGARAWVLRHTVDGRQRRQTLGDVAAMTVAEARAAAHAVLAGGVVAPPEKAADAPTLAAFVAQARPRLAAIWKPSTFERSDMTFRNQLLPVFGAIPMNRIEPTAVAQWFHAFSRTWPGSANHSLGLLRTLFIRAKAWGVLPHDTPKVWALVKRNPRPPVWRILSLDELHRLGRALDVLRETRRGEADAIRLILLTGCRSGEVRRLRWENVKGDAMELTESKSGPRTVRLSAQAAKLLKELRGKRNSGYVFPAKLKKGACLPNLDKAWAAVRAAAELPPTLRLHDLRHTYASRAVMQGETLFMAGKLLGHRNLASTERYAHLEEGYLLAAADRVSEAVDALMS